MAIKQEDDEPFCTGGACNPEDQPTPSMASTQDVVVPLQVTPSEESTSRFAPRCHGNYKLATKVVPRNLYELHLGSDGGFKDSLLQDVKEGTGGVATYGLADETLEKVYA